MNGCLHFDNSFVTNSRSRATHSFYFIPFSLNAGKAGFNVGNPYPCSTFSQIAYDPCFSGTVTETTSPAPTSAETPAPAPTPDNTAPTVAEVPTAGGGGDGGGDSASWRLAGSSAMALVIMGVSFVV